MARALTPIAQQPPARRAVGDRHIRTRTELRSGRLKIARPKGLERHVAELDALCEPNTLVGIVEDSRVRVSTRLRWARRDVQVDVARSITF